MKYSIIKVINGNFFIHAEGITDPNNAIVGYYDLCQALWNESSVNKACVMIVNEDLDVMLGYKEFISHPVTAE